MNLSLLAIHVTPRCLFPVFLLEPIHRLGRPDILYFCLFLRVKVSLKYLIWCWEQNQLLFATSQRKLGGAEGQ